MAKQFNAAKWAMAILATIVITPCLLLLLITIRCVVRWIPACTEKDYSIIFRDWLMETVPVLVAIIVGYRPPPNNNNKDDTKSVTNGGEK